MPASETQPAPALALWHYAGLLLTYWCNAKCAFCYVYSAPDRGGEMSAELAVRIWRGLDELAARGGKTMRVHLAGGEPTGDWPRLLASIRAARDAGCSRLEKVETNAFWATDDDQTRIRLEQLDALGMEKIVISADVYHQEFIPLERAQRCARIAREVLGGGRVRVRWWSSLDEPLDARRRSAAEKQVLFESALARHKDRLTGRAADRLAPLLPRSSAEHFRGLRCEKEVLRSEHVHVDPSGLVFPGVCNGIILGDASLRGVPGVWDDLAAGWRENPVVAAVVRGGSYELMQRAKAEGYVELREGYANKCHLCQHVRQFLVERGGWEKWLGPRECYANERDRQEADAWSAQVRLTQRGAALAGAAAGEGD